MLLSKVFGSAEGDPQDEQNSYAIDLAMARFGYAVADLSERDRTAVIELVERIAEAIRKANMGGRGVNEIYPKAGTA